MSNGTVARCCPGSFIQTPPVTRVGSVLVLLNMTKKFVAESAFLQFTSCNGEGLQLEILAGGPEGTYLPKHPEAVARILADDTEVQWFEFTTPLGEYRLPLSEIERAIEVAKADVHGEAWYDREQPEK